jgi:RNA polymerase sigma-70 factor, ECF subfamily
MDQQQNRDEWLMAEVAAGKREPVETLLRRHVTPLLSFLGRMAGDRHRAEDLFQEVFLAVWSKRRQYVYPRPFKPWLYAIALNKWRAAYRQAPWGGPNPFLPFEENTAPALEQPSPADTAVAVETACPRHRQAALSPARLAGRRLRSRCHRPAERPHADDHPHHPAPPRLEADAVQ